MKLQVLYFSPKGSAQVLAENIGKHLKSKCDKIPPAYPCDNEKLVFVGLEPKAAGKSQFVDFMKGMTADRAKNVAFFACSATGSEGVESAKALVKNNPGVNVVDNVFECKAKGMFHPQHSQEDISACVAWAEGIVKELFDVQ